MPHPVAELFIQKFRDYDFHMGYFNLNSNPDVYTFSQYCYDYITIINKIKKIRYMIYKVNAPTDIAIGNS